ncbi:MAG TPA: hypothetical protein VHU17_08845 [Acidimicrobiales bacterium]|nr:hypothetical protein [Acidimicrobiales bacterium]
MAAIVGLIIGYLLGTRAGDKGRQELEESWKTITTSQGFRDMLGGLFALMGEFLSKSRGALAQKIQPPEIEARSRELEQAA